MSVAEPITYEKFSSEDWNAISKELEKYHSLFYKFWQLGKPIFTNSIPTAAVCFNNQGKCVNFLFNKKFWDECDEYKRIFVIAHECLHVILNHGLRFLDCDYRDIANIAQDVAINHLLIEEFGFVRDLIGDWETYCWTDTVFKNKKHNGLPFPTDESSEFYYNKLLSICKSKNGNSSSNQKNQTSEDGIPSINGLPSTVDDHSKWQNQNADLEGIVNDVLKGMSEEEIKNIKDKLYSEANEAAQAGTCPCLAPVMLDLPLVVCKKKKWESIIKNWEAVVLSCKEHISEQWIRKPRRFSEINTDLFIPSEEITEDYCREKDKINVFFFLDTSGSCIGLAERFFKAAMSLNPKKFNIRLFCFDTAVAETTLESKTVYGGGGTNFQIIEDKIAEIVAGGEKHPHAVFVITDGMGTNVTPKYPKKWYWFNTTNYDNYIPKESKKFRLSDFE